MNDNMMGYYYQIMTHILFLSKASARIHANTKNNSQDITATLRQRCRRWICLKC